MLNRPLKSTILITILWLVISTLLPMPVIVLFAVLGPGLDKLALQMISAVIDIVFSLLFLYLFKRKFSPDYEGTFIFTDLGTGLLLGWPLALQIIIHLYGVFTKGIVTAIPIALLLGLGPGVMEEVVFRGIIGANLMRICPEERKIPYVVILPSVVFGLIHAINMASGANLWITLFQIVFAITSGMLMQAVMLRTGSIVPGIILHTLIDFTSFLTMNMADTGAVLTQELSLAYLIEVIPIAACLIGAFYLVRPAKRAEIRALWDKKWGACLSSLAETRPADGPAEA